MLARAYVRTLLPPAKMSLLELLPLKAVALSYKPPLWHMLLLLTPLKWPELMLIVALVKTFYRLSAAIMSLLNKPQELRLIAVAFALLLLFLLALTAFSSALYSNKKLFTKLKELQPMNTPPSTKEPFKTAPEGLIGSPDFGSSGDSKVTL